MSLALYHNLASATQALIRRTLFSAADWGFDVESLRVARLRGYRIIELPVTWHYDAQTKVNPLRDTWHMLKELMAIRRNMEKGGY